MTRIHWQRSSLISIKTSFCSCCTNLLNDSNESETSAAEWADRQWNMEWESNASRLHDFIFRCQSTSTWSAASQTHLGPAESPPNWHRAFPLNNAQMGHVTLSSLQVWCRGADCRPHHNNMSQEPSF